jgi:hypothetical protein
MRNTYILLVVIQHMTKYYDVVLGLIPLALGGVTAALTAAGFALTTAIPVASVAAVGLMGHAMFVNGPGESGESVGTGTEARSEGSFQSAD